MPVVTGTLTDVGGGHLVGKNPELVFTLNGSNVNGSTIFPTEPASTTPDSTGLFSVVLADTSAMRADAWYSLQIRWLDSAGNYIKADFPDWKIVVPTSGGVLGDLIGGGVISSALVITSPVAPATWYGLAAMWLQLDPSDPNNQNNAGNTGDLYELRNI